MKIRTEAGKAYKLVAGDRLRIIDRSDCGYGSFNLELESAVRGRLHFIEDYGPNNYRRTNALFFSGDCRNQVVDLICYLSHLSIARRDTSSEACDYLELAASK